eukprot:362283-Chlamydomonas_euryale.AAC.2
MPAGSASPPAPAPAARPQCRCRQPSGPAPPSRTAAAGWGARRASRAPAAQTAGSRSPRC